MRTIGTSRVIAVNGWLSWAYLIENETGYFLVDAGAPGSMGLVLKRLNESPGKSLKVIFITHAHFDHYGGAAELRRRTGAKILIHHSDAEDLSQGRTNLGTVQGRGKMVQPFLPFVEALLRPEGTQPDEVVGDLDDLTKFGLPARVVHTPGHTPGSSSLLLEEGIGFAGDLVSTSGGGHIQRYFATDWSALRPSVARLQQFHPTQVYTGHGGSPMGSQELQAL